MADIPDERPLTAAEYQLTRWMLEQAGDGAEDFLAQLDAASVVSRCGCGCASVNFVVAGHSPPTGGLVILADFTFVASGELKGAFVFQQDGVLGGVEVYGLEGDAPPRLPLPEELERL